MSLSFLLAFALWAPLPASAQNPQGEEYVSWLLDRLESPDPDQRRSSYHALLAEKDAAASCLVDFSAASPLARELRASLLRERGSEAQIGTALELFRSEPALAVREQILRFFCRSELGQASLESRCDTIRQAGLEDSSIAEVAVEGLQRLEFPCAGESLAQIFRRGADSKIRDAALAALLKRWSGTTELYDLAKNPGEDRSFLPPVLFALGDRAEPRAFSLFLRHWDDTDLRLRAAARQGFSVLQLRRAQRQELEAALRDFDALIRAKNGEAEWILEKGLFLLMHGENAKDASVCAEDAIRGLAPRSSRDAATTRARAYLLRGVSKALLASGPADESLSKGIAEIEACLRSVDDFEEPERGYVLCVILGKAQTLRALESLLRAEEDVAQAAKHFQAAYAASEQAQRFRDDWLSQTRKRPGTWPYNMDEIFSGELGLYGLMEGPVLHKLSRDRSEALWKRLASLLARLDAQEFPSLFEELPKAKSLLAEDAKRTPSDFPVRLADFFETRLGKSEEALAVYRKLASVWRLRLNDFPGFAQDVARVESRIASLHMDRREAEECEKAIRRALGFLEDLSVLLQARTGEGPDPSLQAQMAACYVSLAVNENVVRHKPEAARVYLEKAYALDPSPFNRVLLACYEARAGRAESARRALEQVDAEPALFYNMACTYALLGEPLRALNYLEQHFQVALRGAGERKRGVEWARKDPDLESLRGKEAFESLMNRIEKEFESGR